MLDLKRTSSCREDPTQSWRNHSSIERDHRRPERTRSKPERVYHRSDRSERTDTGLKKGSEVLSGSSCKLFWQELTKETYQSLHTKTSFSSLGYLWALRTGPTNCPRGPRTQKPPLGYASALHAWMGKLGYLGDSAGYIRAKQNKPRLLSHGSFWGTYTVYWGMEISYCRYFRPLKVIR